MIDSNQFVSDAQLYAAFSSGVAYGIENASATPRDHRLYGCRAVAEFAIAAYVSSTNGDIVGAIDRLTAVLTPPTNNPDA